MLDLIFLHKNKFDISRLAQQPAPAHEVTPLAPVSATRATRTQSNPDIGCLVGNCYFQQAKLCQEISLQEISAGVVPNRDGNRYGSLGCPNPGEQRFFLAFGTAGGFRAICLQASKATPLSSMAIASTFHTPLKEEALSAPEYGSYLPTRVPRGHAAFNDALTQAQRKRSVSENPLVLRF